MHRRHWMNSLRAPTKHSFFEVTNNANAGLVLAQPSYALHKAPPTDGRLGADTVLSAMTAAKNATK
jgi:hypothetical protein